MKKLLCTDAGFNCDAVVTANPDEEVLTIAAEHALTVHGTVVTPKWPNRLKR